MLGLCLVWIISLNSPLNFLCWKKNYPLHSFCSWGPLSVCAHRQKKTKELLYQILSYGQFPEEDKIHVDYGSLRIFSNLRGHPSLTSASESDDLHRIHWGNSLASVRYPSSKDVDSSITIKIFCTKHTNTVGFKIIKLQSIQIKNHKKISFLWYLVFALHHLNISLSVSQYLKYKTDWCARKLRECFL